MNKNDNHFSPKDNMGFNFFFLPHQIHLSAKTLKIIEHEVVLKRQVAHIEIPYSF